MPWQVFCTSAWTISAETWKERKAVALEFLLDSGALLVTDFRGILCSLEVENYPSLVKKTDEIFLAGARNDLNFHRRKRDS
jgi:hypothetical protein